MNGEDYTYREHDGKCRYKESGVVGTPKSCTYVTPTNETALEAAVDQFGPVAISIDATQESFKIVLIKLPLSWPKINFQKRVRISWIISLEFTKAVAAQTLKGQITVF